jgi:hypothetical protein
VKEREADPAGIESSAMDAPVDGLNHSTANLREASIAERSTVNDPPTGA